MKIKFFRRAFEKHETKKLCKKQEMIAMLTREYTKEDLYLLKSYYVDLFKFTLALDPLNDLSTMTESELKREILYKKRSQFTKEEFQNISRKIV